MNKWLFLINLLAVVSLYSSVTYADHNDWRGHGHHHGWHHHDRYYPQSQVNNYYPQPQANYYARPQPNYYQPPYDPRSHQGLAGGVVGSVLGYEIGNGDPIATGLGAAAGSFLGNGIGRRY
ncbi:Glycine zipper 2TM protein [Candidatus Methylobacter favarea]|uniref:Glycine zipper 2TM protein n=1 Tax=Candidatus Methylobacter favarea TaxID=2707345 RepID=A0A8S0WB00_9GAMM|nr:glycine zipper 2TM domain-containing protein [Candidatus Methylobacter favarea]CAA9891259.1 Glycine zipper 2TM protein [Candidatus Methylobacter favarea]